MHRCILEWYWDSRMYGALWWGRDAWMSSLLECREELPAWLVFHLPPSLKIHRLLFVATFQPSMLAVLPPYKTLASLALGWRHIQESPWSGPSTARVGWFPVNHSRSGGQHQLRSGASKLVSLASLTLLKHAVTFTWHRHVCVFLLEPSCVSFWCSP